MPEIKNTFVGGKMNKDLDGRLMPNGQYTNALNIEVSTAEGPGVGVVKNILGNKRIDITNEFSGIPAGFTCVGTIANEKTNKLYWFITRGGENAIDAIIEYDAVNEIVLPVIIDMNAGNSKAVLRFGVTPIITGINIIDNLLLWTDNSTDPKKINIDECKKGTILVNNVWAHTQLTFDNGSFDAITLENLMRGPGDASGDGMDFLEYQPPYGRYFYHNAKQMAKTIGHDGVLHGESYHYVRQYRGGKFLRRVELLVAVLGSGTYGRIWNADPAYTDWGSWPYTGDDPRDFHKGDILYGDNVTVNIEQKHITVIKPKPLLAPSVKINHTKSLNATTSTPNLFETKFPRFSYRYKFRDGEFSTFAPFTSAVFNPKYPKDINNSTETSVFFNRDNVYDVKDPSNKAMTNSIHSIELSGFITAETPHDVVGVDVLYKQENSSVIYSIGTIKHNDPEWHLPCNTEGYDLGYNKAPNAMNSFYAQGGYTKGKYVVTTENIYAALPADQLLRPWDNVPRRALAQEVTGNRIVYGNYLQNYNLDGHKTSISVDYSDRKNNIGSFESQGLPSIKSQRNYQLGVVYCDEFGRETPVFTSSGGAVAVPWADPSGLKNASRSLQLNASVATNFPEWVDSLKFFVKETSNEYYNLVMSRAWVVQKTYELDNSEGHLWISFPSSDRNKVSEGDYIILKKKVGVGESQVANENKFKIIDIKNEAPDAIKYELVNFGSAKNSSNKLTDDMFTISDFRMDKETDTLHLDGPNWMDDWSVRGIPLNSAEDTEANARLSIKDMYISWRREGGAASKKYKITRGRIDNAGDNYTLKLQNKISKIDADIAHVSGASDGINNGPATLHGDLVVLMEKREVKSGEDFSGSFFVKISKNQITDIIESGNATSVLDNHQVSAKTPVFYWRDVYAGNSGNGTNNQISTAQNGYGLTNYNGLDNGSLAGVTNIIHQDNNTVGYQAGTPYLTTTLKLTDFAEAWEGIYNNYTTAGVSTFFLDGMHMVAGQSEASDYAKYCCVTWSGAFKDQSLTHNLIRGDSAWSYAPLKSWLGEYEGVDSLVGNLDSDTPMLLDNMLITTSDQLDDNEDWGANKVDGWVGHSQHVIRRTQESVPAYAGHAGLSHVNGLEGLVTSVKEHSEDCRRWFSGITGGETEFGVGVDTKTYSDDGEVGRHFMHLSFFAPGDDLHNNDMGSDGQTGSFQLYGPNSVAARLQGIWGGGHFTGENLSDKFGINGGQFHSHVCLEGNYDEDNNFLPEAPGPGVGHGYDLKYKELHERQWDPTFPSDPGNKIRDFVRNLHAGSQFKFNPPEAGHPNITGTNKTEADNSVYTIKSVTTKKLYNHTSWRNTFNRWDATDGYASPSDPTAYWSVERAGMHWLNYLDNAGQWDGVSGSDGHLASDLMWKKIVDFGKSHNRRVCYIIELDKDPDADGNFNPIRAGLTYGRMSADHTNGKFHNIEFLEKTKSVAGITDLNKFPAIWETDPVKQDVDLDIYFEASSNIPVKLNDRSNEIFAPLGCVVEPLNAPVAGTSHLIEWNGLEATFEPGLPLTDGVNEIDYSGTSFKFTKGDGSFVIAKADTNILTGFSADPLAKRTTIVFKEDIGENIKVGLAWNNCFSFGNGLESNRIKDDFNQMFLLNGVRASITTQQTYEEERRSTGLIFSGLYNSNSGVNDLNQFLMAEKITKDLNPTFGSIQKLFQRRISLVAFCEDRVVSITSNKDAIYNADGNPQLIASNRVLGDANPFEGNFGISKNPESFASESYRAYFTDKNRGAVIRLSKDGLTPISDSGMHDWFRDNLPKFDTLIGTFDSYKEDYNITLSDTFGENLLFNSYVSGGTESGTVSGGFVNSVLNAAIYNAAVGSGHLQYPFEEFDVATNSNFLWSTDNDNLTTRNRVTNHAQINPGDVYAGLDAAPATYLTPGDPNPYTTGNTTTSTSYDYGSDPSTVVVTTTTVTAGTAHPYVAPAFAQMLGMGALYEADFNTTGLVDGGPGLLFGQTGINNSDPNNYSFLQRHFPLGFGGGYGQYIQESAQSGNSLTDSTWAGLGWIVQEGSTGNILFSRLQQQPGHTGFVEFRSLGVDPSTAVESPGALDNGLLHNYNANNPPGVLDSNASVMFGGDEVMVSITFKTEDTYTDQYFGEWNKIVPRIELRDGPGTSAGGAIPTSKLHSNSTIYQPGGITGTVGSGPTTYFQNNQDSVATAAGTYQGSNGKWHAKGWCHSSVVDFPQTDTTANTYTAYAFFKFKGTTPGNKVVDDLVVRVMNVGSTGNSTTYNGGPGEAGTGHRPRWRLLNLTVKKILNIQSAGVDAYVDDDTVNQTTVTQAGQVDQPAIVAVPAIPTVTIPAWTEVKNYGINDWVVSNITGGNSYSYKHYASQQALGNTFEASPQTATPNDAAGNPVDPLYWLIPGATPSGGSPHGTTGYHLNGIPTAIASPGYETAHDGRPSSLISEFPNEYFRVSTVGTDAMFDLTYTATTDQWVDDAWYLIDVEYEDDSVNDGDTLTGTGGSHGEVSVHGVTDFPSGTVHGDIVDVEGVGTHSNTTNNNNNITMVPVTRTEYGNTNGTGDHKTVLRALFQFKGTSYRAATAARRKQLILRFSRFTHGTKITKIITRKLGLTSSGGEADNWTHGTDNTPHSFSKRSMYYENNSLCWEDHTSTYSNGGAWTQVFAPGDAPQVSAKNWRLRFKVEDNPNLASGNMAGALAVQVANAIGDASATEFEAFYVGGMDSVGTYEFTFNMDGDIAATHANGSPVWTAKKNGVDWTGYSYFTSVSAVGWTQTQASYANRIRFWGGTNGGPAATAAISEILLTDETLVLTGGTAGSWSWNGFDDAVDDYIVWDVAAQRIQYNSCPAIDPLYSSGGAVQISASQPLELPIKKHEKYEISVAHGLSSGQLSVYYFNGAGHGFRMLNIQGYDTTTATVEVGDYTWSGLNPADNSYAPEFKNTFVIRQHDSSPEVTGWIDNITMVRQYDLSVREPITASFSEKVNGWTSFKSFIPEGGVSLSKKFFTVSNGGLWQHYMPLVKDSAMSTWVDSSAEEAANYNNFYNMAYTSSITAVLNNEPSVVKTFNTLNYEGSQSQIKVPVLVGDTSGYHLTAVDQVTIDNAQAWDNVNPVTGMREDVLGWNCVRIETDLEAGSVKEFINKEGKWFAYIKGDILSQGVDTKLFSVQGIGVASNIVSL